MRFGFGALAFGVFAMLAAFSPFSGIVSALCVEKSPKATCLGVGGAGLGIPDNDLGGLSDIIVVPNSGIIEDLDVDLVVSHSSRGDLQITVAKVRFECPDTTFCDPNDVSACGARGVKVLPIFLSRLASQVRF